MLDFVCSYPENSQKMIRLKYMYVCLILNIYNRIKSLSSKLVLHQILIQIRNIFSHFFSFISLKCIWHGVITMKSRKVGLVTKIVSSMTIT